MGTNKVCIITGSNSGIGKVTATELAKTGYEVVMLVRSGEKSDRAHEEIKQVSGSEAVNRIDVDLASLQSIRKASETIKGQYESIDILINNAGVFKRVEDRSVDGFEMTIAVNYIAPFYLTDQLLPLLERSERARIINLTSELYKNGQVLLQNGFSPERFDGNKAYANSKLLLMYYSKALADKLSRTNITVNTVHPGVVGTDVLREYPGWRTRGNRTRVPGRTARPRTPTRTPYQQQESRIRA